MCRIQIVQPSILHITSTTKGGIYGLQIKQKYVIPETASIEV